MAADPRTPPPPPDARRPSPSAPGPPSPGPSPPGGRAGRRPPARSRFLLVMGLCVLAVGLWLLLDALGVEVPPLGRHWPLFLLLGGLASLLDWWRVSRRPASAGQAVVGLGLGVLGYLAVFDVIGWRGFDDWWPLLPAIAGAAFLAAWAAGGRESVRQLTLGLVGLGVAVTGWGWHLVRLQILWAAILLLLGGFVLWRTLGSRE